jgi:hypothetical protein
MGGPYYVSLCPYVVQKELSEIKCEFKWAVHTMFPYVPMWFKKNCQKSNASINGRSILCFLCPYVVQKELSEIKCEHKWAIHTMFPYVPMWFKKQLSIKSQCQKSNMAITSTL